MEENGRGMSIKAEAHRGPSSLGSTDKVVSLTALHPGEHGEVVELAGGRRMLSRMTALGFTPGADVTVVQNYGRGPLIARVRGARIALGRGEAERVFVCRRSM